MDSSIIAKVCHEANLVICHFNGEDTQKNWNECPQSQRESMVKGVEFRLANPDSTPEDQHNAWMEDKINEGWAFGEVKDVNAKTHPSLVEYSELPESVKIKDNLFQGIVDSLKSFIPKAEPEAPKEEMVDVVVSEEDLANNAGLQEQGVKAGETIQIPKKDFDEAEAKSKKESEKVAKTEAKSGK